MAPRLTYVSADTKFFSLLKCIQYWVLCKHYVLFMYPSTDGHELLWILVMWIVFAKRLEGSLSGEIAHSGDYLLHEGLGLIPNTLKGNKQTNLWVSWHMLVLPKLGKQRQDDGAQGMMTALPPGGGNHCVMTDPLGIMAWWLAPWSSLLCERITNFIRTKAMAP